MPLACIRKRGDLQLIKSPRVSWSDNLERGETDTQDATLHSNAKMIETIYVTSGHPVFRIAMAL